MKKYQCLIIDDSLTAVITLKSHLNKLAIFLEPQVCSSVVEAIPLFTRISVDLILLNMRLPAQSGLLLLQAFARPIPIIATTPYTSFALSCYQLNIVDCILKPYTLPRFSRAINRALDVQAMVEKTVEQKNELRIFWENLTADYQHDLTLLFQCVALYERALRIEPKPCK